MPPLSNKEIATMAYKDLQGACREAGLSAGGSTGTLRKRLRAVALPSREGEKENDVEVVDIQEPPPKKQRSAADDLVCPISLELPFDPVTAEDGRVYDRSAIEKYMEGTALGNLKSPMTMVAMGKRLFPAIQHKNLIQTLIDDSVITGELAEVWNEKVREKAETDDLLKRANGGDGDAMLRVARRYNSGRKGFKKDGNLSFAWYQQAHHAGKVAGTANVGWFLATGRSRMQVKHTDGVMYLSLAAERGSAFAACKLGIAKADGKYSLSVDNKEAIRWLQKSLTPESRLIHGASKTDRALAHARLQTLLKED